MSENCAACRQEPSLQHTCPERCVNCDGFGLVTVVETVEGIAYEAGDYCPECKGAGRIEPAQEEPRRGP